ncbi:MAG: cytochrome b/b6 domain-containing protein [Candidatus Kapaibacteriota bacterium]
MHKIYLYPLWLRIWHIINATLFILLILTGVSLHFSADNALLFPFQISVLTHNISGILLTLNYIYFFTFNLISGNYKYYIPKLKGLKKRILLQAKYYLLGIFNQEPHPFSVNEDSKFNPLQQLGYLSIMYLLLPIIVISGWALMFPEYAPDNFFGMGGVWPMALLHTITGFALILFLFVHIYLGTTGHTVGELYKTIITGWHLSHEDETSIAIETEKKLNENKRTLPIILYNPITITGSLIAAISFLAILVMIVVELLSTSTNAYTGLVTFVALPTVLGIGVFLIIFGAFRENRRLLLNQSEKEKRLPILDLNNPKHQASVVVFTLGTLILLVSTIYGSFKAYDYMETDEFCGTVCHSVMEPEYTAYQNNVHSRVHCVKCHIGPGAGWFVKSKISGSYQLLSVSFNLYSRPIQTPVHDLRPSPETCEQCHWPNQFYAEKKVDFDFFTSDEKNSNYKISMLLKIGGGSSESSNKSGIHWKMYIENEISYYATDFKRQIIPWVRVRNRQTGKETYYTSTDSKFKMNDSILRTDAIRKFDCIDCHNRPAHNYRIPNKIVNNYLTYNKIDRSIPYIKNMAVQTLESNAIDQKNAYRDISKYLYNFYSNYYPNVLIENKKGFEQAVKSVTEIFSRNYFPNMKVSWRAYPNNIGHMYSKGCFRCHDGKHVSPEGKVISADCNTCHSIISQQPPNQELVFAKDQEFIHPGGMDKFVKSRMCPDCHAARPKNTVLETK